MNKIIIFVVAFLVLRFFFKSAKLLIKVAIMAALVILFIKFRDVLWM
ncbi:hypothetical protein [Pseudoleptotrichia goodfellowii]|uniref:Uncharacterized protein n=1 Tax=Pseudoleptotrichia goodfellowii F0264 TaxID=596323 RepID=D0GJU3_9FUSO|nr:hypothetical protein [Pseudoleptotrichia goodfellowii]EEY35595.1 hypothetical protein HMPREF0554_1084 [Pseudoleptotrichia goodfellowii F0264]MBF4806832.1 hypothetical protein [Pseudoleptotrichia goodfellowii]